MGTWEKKDDRTETLAGKVGNEKQIDNAATIEILQAINGSGAKSFGGAKQWPKLRLEVSFQQGEEDKRDQLIKELKQVVADFLYPEPEEPVVDDEPHEYCVHCGEEIPPFNSECGCEEGE